VTTVNNEWVMARQNQLDVLNGPSFPTYAGRYASNMTTTPSWVVVPLPDAFWTVDLVSGMGPRVPLRLPTCLAPVAAFLGNQVAVLSPEWRNTWLYDGTYWTYLPSHDLFSAEETFSATLWDVAPPRAVLLGGSDSLVEVASMGGRSSLRVHAISGAVHSFAIPAGDYCCGARRDSQLYLVTFGGETADAQVVTATTDGTAFSAVVDQFNGQPRGVAVGTDRLYISDADHGIRVYSLSGAAPGLLGVVHP